MYAMVEEYFKSQTFRATDSISVSGNCKIRRIFTMKDAPALSVDDLAKYRGKVANYSSSKICDSR